MSLVHAVGFGDITDSVSAECNLNIVGQNRNTDIGLRVHVSSGDIVKIGKVAVTRCFVNLLKTGDGELHIEELVTREFGGDNANLLGSNVYIGNLDAADNTPTRPYSMCIRQDGESVVDCLARHSEKVFDPALLKFEQRQVDGVMRDVILGYHVDGIAQIFNPDATGDDPDRDCEISNIRIPRVKARIKGKYSQGVMGSELCDYHGVEIGTELFDVELDGYEFHTVFNTLRNSNIGCSTAKAQGKLKILNVKGANAVSENINLTGIDRRCVVGDLAAVNFLENAPNGGGDNVDREIKVEKMSAAGLRQLIESEKPMSRMYYCEAGHPTIGVGHEMTRSEVNTSKIHLSDGTIIDFRDGRELSHDEIMRLLSDDLISREKVVCDSVTAPLDQHNFDSLVHFVFNIGRTAFMKSTLLKELNGFRYAEVPGQIKRWKYVTKNGVKVESRGLVNRRLTEVSMWHGSSQRSDDMKEWFDRAAAPAKQDIDLAEAAEALGVTAEKPEATLGYDKTLEIAKKQAKDELEYDIAVAKAEAVDSFRVENTQKPMQSRTNKSIVGVIVSAGLRILVSATGLSYIFAEPAVAEAVTGLVVTGLDVATVGLSGAAIKFRNAATKFIS